MPDNNTPPTNPPAPPAAPTPPPEKPAWLGEWKGPAIPEKFHKATLPETLAEVTKAYGGLEQMVSRDRGPPPKKDDQPPATPTPPAPAAGGDTGLDINTEAEPETIDAFVESIGLKPDEIGKQFAEKGQLTNEQYAAFKKAGIPRAVVDGTLANIRTTAKATQDTIRAEAVKIVGSADQLDALLANASQFVPAEELPDLAARAKNPKHFRGALRDLMQFHAEAVGAGRYKAPVGGTPVSAPSGGGYTSRAEWSKASAAAAKAREAGRPDTATEARLRATNVAALA